MKRKTQRIIAYVLRFIKKCRKTDERSTAMNPTIPEYKKRQNDLSKPFKEPNFMMKSIALIQAKHVSDSRSESLLGGRITWRLK